jgi:hypothetical protein
MRPCRFLLLLLALLLGVAACAKPTPPPAELKWTGDGLAGATFAQREMEGVTIHYMGPTMPDKAETLGQYAAATVALQKGWGRAAPGGRVQIWVVPAGRAWPTGLDAPPPFRGFRAGAPGVVVAREEALTDTSGQGMPEALAVAVTQPKGSPAFAVDWLHEGMGAVFATDLNEFPLKPWRQAITGGGDAGEMLRRLSAKPGEGEKDQWRRAALALATLTMDRWGVAWTANYPKQPGDLTPVKAAMWATGGADEAAATALFQERIGLVKQIPPNGGVLYAMADLSPVRLEPKLPALPKGPGPMANYSPTAYAIDARYDSDTRVVAGSETFTWQNGEGIPIDTLYFNLWPNAEQYAKFGGAMTVEAVTVDGKAAPFTASVLDLMVPLGRSVGQGEQVTVQLQFTTRVPSQITYRVLGQAPDTKLFNLAHWYPILAVLDDRGWVLHPLPEGYGEPYSENSSYTVTIDVPAGTVLGATGHPVSRTEQGNRWVYKYDAPNVKDWVAVGGPGLTEVTRQAGDVTVRVLDPDAKAAGTIAEETEKSLNLFQPQFGTYPYKDLVVVPCCAGLEYPGLFYTALPGTQQGNWWHTVLYHELAHQWFFGIVGNDQYDEAWLDEGFARYGERLGNKAFGYTDQLRDLSARTIPPQVHVNSSTLDFDIWGGYVAGVYDMGAAALEDLEQLLGPETFRQVLRTYVARYQFKTATTADFVGVAEEVSGRNLQDFFRMHRIDPTLREPYRPIMPPGTVKPK